MLFPSKHVELLNRLAERGELRPGAGSEIRSRCPAHPDDNPSLSITLNPTRDHSLLICRAGCSIESILAALDLGMDQLFHTSDATAEFEIPASAGGRRPAGSMPSGDQSETVPFPVVDPDTHDRVYRAIFAGLTLSEDHRRALAARGLDDVEIDRRGYRSHDRFALRQAIGRIKAEFAEPTLLGIPGFRLEDRRLVFTAAEGLLIPVRDAAGRIVAIKVRTDRDGDGPKYVYVSSADAGGPSPGSPTHVPLGTPARAVLVRLTEGELKADIASARSDVPTLGAPGVVGWRACLPTLRSMEVEVVLVAFDADFRTKPGVARALTECVRGLGELGFEVRVEVWDAIGPDGAAAKGIDDLLAADRQPDVLVGDTVAALLSELAGPPDTEEAGDWEPGGAAEGGAPFPLTAFPPVLRNFASTVAASLQCPVDFIAVFMLAVAGAAIGAARRLRVRPGYEEGARIYAAVVAPPGSAKSPALRAVCAPIYAEQQRLHAEYRAAMAEYERALDTPASSAGASPRPVRPAMRHLYVGDVTVEALSHMLARSPRGLIKICDELTGWIMGMNQYKGGRGSDRQFYLSGWSGEPIKVDRRSNADDPLLVPDPFLSVIGGIQPGRLSELDAGDDGEDGFVHRILLVFPRPVGTRQWRWEGLPEAPRAAWAGAISALYALAPGRDDEGEAEPVVLDFTPGARDVWEEWYNRHAREMTSADFPDLLTGPWSKQVAYAARLALIVHLLRGACGEDVGENVDAESLGKALELIAYFQSHARVIYPRLRAGRDNDQVRRAVAWIRAHGGTCTPTDLVRNNVAGVRRKSEAETLMKAIEDYGYGRRETARSANNRTVTTLHLFKVESGQVGPSRTADRPETTS
jgi:hypothetical protein